jgi:SAM-dependent methyltransferase
MIDTDWLILRGMRPAIEALVAEVGRAEMTALDFGCGSRPYEPLLASAGIAYVGADFGAGADVPIDDQGRLGVPGSSTDLLLSFQVLEHVRRVDLYLSEALRVLKTDGWMILSTHGAWLYHPHPEDHRRWTRQGLVAEIETAGFEVIRCVPVVGPLAWTSLIRLTGVCYILRKVPLVGRPAADVAAFLANCWAWIEDRVTPKSMTADNACVYVTLSRPRGPDR